MRKTLAAAVAVIAVLALSGCSEKQQEQFKDADRGASNTGPADIMTFPDGFSNVASKCDGPNRVYVIFHQDSAYGSVAVVPNDPRCN
jgi:hypothetical protein